MTSKTTKLAMQANDLEASAAIDKERADALRRKAEALDKTADGKRARAAELRRQVDADRLEGGRP